MVCLTPGNESNAEFIRNFITDPGIDTITGKRRLGQSALLDHLQDIIISIDPSAVVIRINDTEDIDELRVSLDSGKYTTGYILADGSKNSFAVMDVVGDRDFSVFYSQELCHQVPVCKKLRQKKG